MSVAEGESPLRVAVVGTADADEGEYALARALGRALAQRGVLIVCGGRGGVMEAASRGAHEAGGTVVGILPGEDASEANRWVAVPLATGMGEARNALVVRAAEAIVAVGGRWGTLSEIALGRAMGRAVLTLGRPPADGLGLPSAPDAESAAEWAVAEARVYRASRERVDGFGPEHGGHGEVRTPG